MDFDTLRRIFQRRVLHVLVIQALLSVFSEVETTCCQKLKCTSKPLKRCCREPWSPKRPWRAKTRHPPSRSIESVLIVIDV